MSNTDADQTGPLTDGETEAVQGGHIMPRRVVRGQAEIEAETKRLPALRANFWSLPPE
jgi:hypothetical protein